MIKAIPTTLKDANQFVANMHRHHKPTIGHKFSIGAAIGETIVGVVICGRPVARNNDDGRTIEVYRCCTDGHPNACSFLYGAAWRAAKAMGYSRATTYTLPSEGGTSLRAAGWRLVGKTEGGEWARPSRFRNPAAVPECKWRWEIP